MFSYVFWGENLATFSWRSFSVIKMLIWSIFLAVSYCLGVCFIFWAIPWLWISFLQIILSDKKLNFIHEKQLHTFFLVRFYFYVQRNIAIISEKYSHHFQIYVTKTCWPARTVHVIMFHDVIIVYIIEFQLNKVFNIV